MGCASSSLPSHAVNERVEGENKDPFGLPKHDAALDPRFQAELKREKKEKANKIPPPATGYMSKEQGQGLLFNKAFQRRFFVLKLGLLEYFEKEAASGEGDISTKKGEVLLTGMTLTESLENGRKLLILTPSVEGERIWKLECNDDDARSQWADAMKNHINYLNRCCCSGGEGGGGGGGGDNVREEGGGGGGGGSVGRERRAEFHNLVATAKEKKEKEEKERENRGKKKKVIGNFF